MQRTFGSRVKDHLPGTDKMGLKNYEWQNLQQNYGTQLEASWNKSNDNRKVNSILEANGIKPDFKTKAWIYSLVAALGIGALTTFGIVPVAASVGSVAPTVGKVAAFGLK